MTDREDGMLGRLLDMMGEHTKEQGKTLKELGKKVDECTGEVRSLRLDSEQRFAAQSQRITKLEERRTVAGFVSHALSDQKVRRWIYAAVAAVLTAATSVVGPKVAAAVQAIIGN